MNSRKWILGIALFAVAVPVASLSACTSGLGTGDQTPPGANGEMAGSPIVPNSANVISRAQQLTQQQNAKSALDLLTSHFPSNRSHTEHAARVLETVSGIITTAGKQQERGTVDDAIGYAQSMVNQSLSNDQLAGKGKVEIAYPFMQAISQVAHAAITMDDDVASELLVQVGRIARNLEVNPTFPTQALRGIAANIVAEAKGYALRGNIEKATESLKLAYQWGFVDFHLALNDEVLCSIDTDGNLEKMTLEARDRYRATVLGQVRTALAQFGRHSLEFRLQGIEKGKTLSSADYRGEVLVLDLGATWCAPCVHSIPHLNRLQEEYADRGVRILNASFENQASIEENRKLLKEFVKKHEINYDVALGTDQLKSAIPGFQTFPGLVFIDAQGTVRYVANGYHDYTQISTILECILDSNRL